MEPPEESVLYRTMSFAKSLLDEQESGGHYHMVAMSLAIAMVTITSRSMPTKRQATAEDIYALGHELVEKAIHMLVDKCGSTEMLVKALHEALVAGMVGVDPLDDASKN